MTGIVTTKARLEIRPGKDPVAQRLAMQGDFTLRTIHFTNPEVQDKIDMLSLRAKGEPKLARRSGCRFEDERRFLTQRRHAPVRQSHLFASRSECQLSRRLFSRWPAV